MCQKLIKRQQKQGDGDQSLIECANPASAASMLQEAAAELFAAAHIPPPPAASGKEEDGPRSPGDKAVDLCNTSGSESEQEHAIRIAARTEKPKAYHVPMVLPEYLMLLKSGTG